MIHLPVRIPIVAEFSDPPKRCRSTARACDFLAPGVVREGVGHDARNVRELAGRAEGVEMEVARGRAAALAHQVAVLLRLVGVDGGDRIAAIGFGQDVVAVPEVLGDGHDLGSVQSR